MSESSDPKPPFIPPRPVMPGSTQPPAEGQPAYTPEPVPANPVSPPDPASQVPVHPEQQASIPAPSSFQATAPPQPVAIPAVTRDAAPVTSRQFAETAALLERMKVEIRKVFYGQDEVVDQLLACLISGGHVLLEGKPGLGKTHLVLAMAHTFGGDFGRIQFTPDLMPSDVTGHTLYDMGSQQFRVRKGPVFANLLLSDEINRAPAKTQASLLEVMQEMQVTIDGESMKLEPPFMTIATQNPIEQEGTYPLPEAQLDRFLIKVLIDYPEEVHERSIVSAVAAGAGGQGLKPETAAQVATSEDILKAQQDVASVRAVDEVVHYAVQIVRATRTAQGISLGAGTRGAIGLIRVAKAYAVMDGRDYITPHDVKLATLPVLRHRVTLAPELVISGQSVDYVLSAILQSVEAPR